jgi:hypothetical protein
MSEENSEVDALGKLVEAVSLASVTPKTPDRGSSLKNEEHPTVQKIKIRMKRTEKPINRSKSENESVGVSSEVPVPVLSSIEPPVTVLSSIEPPVTVLSSVDVPVSVLSSVEVPVSVLSSIEPQDNVISTSIQAISKEENPPWFAHVRHVDLDTTPDLSDFSLKDHFVKVADIVPDTELRKKDANGGKGKKKKDQKSRQTLLKFVPTIPKKTWEKKGEYIYLFIVDGKIVKIGCTRTSIDARCGGYLSGHGIPEVTGGTAGSTNAFIYWTFVWLLSQGKKIEMFSAEIPKVVVVQTFFGFSEKIETQVCHRWERRAMLEYQKQFGKLPPLSSNYDPSE